MFALQDKVIAHILAADLEAEAKAAVPAAVDPIQQTVAEELKDALRRQSFGKGDGNLLPEGPEGGFAQKVPVPFSAGRELTKACIRFLSQPMGVSLHRKLKQAQETWNESRDDGALLATVALLAEQFSKQTATAPASAALKRDDLVLICFDYLST